MAKRKPSANCAARALADQMLEVKKRYGASHIFFADEAITPRNLRGLSAILAEEDPDLNWGGCVRFEKVIDQPLLHAMAGRGLPYGDVRSGKRFPSHH